MKTIKFFTYAFFALSLVLASCSAEDGEDGLDGQDGTIGVAGQDGTDGTDGVDGVDGADGTDGQDGSDGTDGTDGEDGEDGNANVIASDWIPAEFGASAQVANFFDIEDPIFTEETASNSVILVYGRRSSTNTVYPIPYEFTNFDYNFLVLTRTTEIRFIAASVSGSPVALDFLTDFRYVVIPPVTTRSSQSSLEATKTHYESQGLDLNDYDAVMEYFDL